MEMVEWWGWWSGGGDEVVRVVERWVRKVS